MGCKDYLCATAFACYEITTLLRYMDIEDKITSVDVFTMWKKSNMTADLPHFYKRLK